MSVSDLSRAGLRALLKELAAGEDRPLFSPDDWAEFLDDGPHAGMFLDQLREEWLPIPGVPDQMCAQLMNAARYHLSSRYDGWPHLWSHTLRVTGIAMALAPEAGIEPEHAFLLGIYHDVGKADELIGNTSESHEAIGARIVRQELRTYLSDPMVTLLATVVAKKSRFNNPYTRLIHDADKLDKIGATGIARRLSSDFGTHYPALALRRVRTDLKDFPAMTFPTSQRLVGLKREFTGAFLEQLGE